MGKTVYEESRELELTWDQEFPTQLVNQWNKWLTSSPYKITIPRSISLPDANKNHADIRIVADSSITGTQQNITASKSRLARQKLSIPKLELVLSSAK